MNSQATGVRTVAVLGAGTAGLSAAAAFASALPQVQTRLIDPPSRTPSLIDRLPGTLPSIHAFHEAIGLDGRALIASGIAWPRLGTRLVNWSAGGAPWFHGFGSTGRPLGTVPFHHLWVRARSDGCEHPFHRFAATGALAERDKLPAGRVAELDQGLSLDPVRYRRELARLCEARGVGLFRSDAVAIERAESGLVTAVLLADGRRVDADLFIDCSGQDGLLRAIGGPVESWEGWLPEGELHLRHQPASGAVRMFDVAAAEPGGWRLRAPSPAGVTECVLGTLATPARQTGDWESMPLRTGRAAQAWAGNVLAIGEAACTIGPLHAANLHLAQSATLRALALLPDRRFGTLELREYNRQTAEEQQRVLDFLALHHLWRTERGPLTAEPALARMPPSLAHTVAQFGRRGRLPFYEEETFGRDSWITALLALGVIPQLSGAIAGGVERDALAALMQPSGSEHRSN